MVTKFKITSEPSSCRIVIKLFRYDWQGRKLNLWSQQSSTIKPLLCRSFEKINLAFLFVTIHIPYRHIKIICVLKISRINWDGILLIKCNFILMFYQKNISISGTKEKFVFTFEILQRWWKYNISIIINNYVFIHFISYLVHSFQGHVISKSKLETKWLSPTNLKVRINLSVY